MEEEDTEKAKDKDKEGGTSSENSENIAGLSFNSRNLEESGNLVEPADDKTVNLNKSTNLEVKNDCDNTDSIEKNSNQTAGTSKSREDELNLKASEEKENEPQITKELFEMCKAQPNRDLPLENPESNFNKNCEKAELTNSDCQENKFQIYQGKHVSQSPIDEKSSFELSEDFKKAYEANTATVTKTPESSIAQKHPDTLMEATNKKITQIAADKVLNETPKHIDTKPDEADIKIENSKPHENGSGTVESLEHSEIKQEAMKIKDEGKEKVPNQSEKISNENLENHNTAPSSSKILNQNLEKSENAQNGDPKTDAPSENVGPNKFLNSIESKLSTDVSTTNDHQSKNYCHQIEGSPKTENLPVQEPEDPKVLKASKESDNLEIISKKFNSNCDET